MKKGFRILKFKKDRPIFEVKDISKSFDVTILSAGTWVARYYAPGFGR